jgi:hypothetical protein
MLLESPRMSVPGLIAMVTGFVMTNTFHFIGLFLVAVAGLLAIREFVVSRKYTIAIALAVSVGVFAALMVIVNLVWGYNHVLAFFTASTLENPLGFRGWHQPISYLATRVECISESAFFLSFGFVAVLFHRDILGISLTDWRRNDTGLFLAAIIVLLAMLTVGAYQSSETGRGALFVYPYAMLVLCNAETGTLKDIAKLAGIQTAAMQLVGNFFW